MKKFLVQAIYLKGNGKIEPY